MAQHSLQWKPGGYGRGLLLEDGSVHTWRTHLDGAGLTHGQMVRRLGEPSVASYFWLGQGGELDFGEAWGPNMDPRPEHVEAIKQVDPQFSWKQPDNYTFARVAMPVTPNWHQQYGEGFVYHNTSDRSVAPINQLGLLPWDHPNHPGKTNFPTAYDRPRAGHVYFTDEVDHQTFHAPGKPVILRTRLKNLDPNHINPDEDAWAGWLGEGKNKPVDWQGVPPFGEIGDYDNHGMSPGMHAEQHGLGEHPEDTQNSITSNGHIAYRGTVAPHHLEYAIPREGWAAPKWAEQNENGELNWKPLHQHPKAQLGQPAQAVTKAPGGLAEALGAANRGHPTAKTPEGLKQAENGLNLKTPESVRISEGQATPEDSFFDEGDPSREGMRAVVYHPQTNHVMIGQEGMHHADVMDEFGLVPEGESVYELTSDQMGDDFPSDVHYGLIHPGALDPSQRSLTTWGPWHSEFPHVMEAMRDQGYIDKHPSSYDEGWHFGAAYNMRRMLKLNDGRVLDSWGDASHSSLAAQHGVQPHQITGYGYQEDRHSPEQWIDPGDWKPEVQGWGKPAPQTPTRTLDQIWQFAKVTRAQGDKVDFTIYPTAPNPDEVEGNARVVVLKDGRWIVGMGHHEWLMKDAGIDPADVAKLGGKMVFPGESPWWWLNDHNTEMRKRWVKIPDEAPTPPTQPWVFGKTAAPGDGDGWTTTHDGSPRWGLHGAAGMLFRHVDEAGQERYYLQHRQGVHHADTWGIPGGAIDSHEQPHEGALREVTEELGFTPQHNITHTTTADHGGWAYHTVHADVPQQFTSQPGWEHQADGWFTPEEMGKLPLHPGFASYWNGRTASFNPAAPDPDFVDDGEMIEPFNGKWGRSLRMHDGSVHRWSGGVDHDDYINKTGLDYHKVDAYGMIHDGKEAWLGNDDYWTPGQDDWHFGALPHQEFMPGYYHVAPTSERARILQHGLQPSAPWLNNRYYPTGQDPEKWLEAEGPYEWEDEHKQNRIEMMKSLPQGVYLSENPENAQQWMRGHGIPHDTWYVPADQVHDLHSDPDLHWEPFHYAPHAIPQPQLMRGHEHGMTDQQWDFAKQAPDKRIRDLHRMWDVPVDQRPQLKTDIVSHTASEPSYFHVTPAANRESILQHGLRLPEAGTRAIWMVDNEDEARGMAPKSWGGSRYNDIWKVQPHTVEPDPHGWLTQQGSAWATSHPIPAHRLTLHSPAEERGEGLRIPESDFRSLDNNTVPRRNELRRSASQPWTVTDSDFSPEQSYNAGPANLQYTHSPFIADPDTSTIYLGRPGVHHHDLVQHHMPGRSIMGDNALLFGAIDQGRVTVGNGDEHTDDIGAAVAQHTGTDYFPEDDDWRFSRIAAVMTPEHWDAWRPGVPGKGFVMSDGRVYAWDGSDYEESHHLDGLEAVFGPRATLSGQEMEKVKAWFEINDDQVNHAGRDPQATKAAAEALGLPMRDESAWTFSRVATDRRRCPECGNDDVEWVSYRDQHDWLHEGYHCTYCGQHWDNAAELLAHKPKESKHEVFTSDRTASKREAEGASGWQMGPGLHHQRGSQDGGRAGERGRDSHLRGLVRERARSSMRSEPARSADQQAGRDRAQTVTRVAVGNTGWTKMIELKDGTRHEWAVPHEDGLPSHIDKMSELGIGPHDVEGFGEIDPDGNEDWWDHASYEPEQFAHLPGKRWRFAKGARSATPTLANVPSIMYHAAPAADHESVMRHGLDWRYRDQSYDWRSDDEDYEQYPVGNYMTSDLERAKEYARGGHNIYTVDTTGLHLHPDPDEDWHGAAWFTTEPVHPSRLRLYDDGRAVASATLTSKAGTRMSTPYYHVAPASARDSIQQHGIDYAKGKSGTDYDAVGNERGNYLWVNSEDAEYSRETHEENLGQPWDVWQVNGEGLTLHPDPYWQKNPDTVEPMAEAHYTPEPIHPSRLNLYKDDTAPRSTTSKLTPPLRPTSAHLHPFSPLPGRRSPQARTRGPLTDELAAFLSPLTSTLTGRDNSGGEGPGSGEMDSERGSDEGHVHRWHTPRTVELERVPDPHDAPHWLWPGQQRSHVLGPESRPSFREFPIVGSIREATDFPDGDPEGLYHNAGQESQMELPGRVVDVSTRALTNPRHRPVIHVPSTQTTYRGSPGGNHTDIIESTPELREHYEWDRFGPKGMNKNVYHGLEYDNGTVEWYNGPWRSQQEWKIGSESQGTPEAKGTQGSQQNMIGAPVVYHDLHGEWRWGQPGQYHQDIDLPDHWEDKPGARLTTHLHHGLVHDTSKSTGQGVVLEWYEGVPRPQVAADLSKRIGQPVTESYGFNHDEPEQNQFWTFSKTASEDPDPWHFRYLMGMADGSTKEINRFPYAGDHSMLVHPESRTIFLGDHGIHHSDLWEATGAPRNMGGEHDGWIPAAVWDGKLEPYALGADPKLWQDVHSQFAPAHQKLYGEKLNLELQDDNWKFGRKILAENSGEVYHNWKPGSTGKGLIDANGVVHTWNTEGGLDGWPGHSDYIAENNVPTPIQDGVYFSSNGALRFHPLDSKHTPIWEAHGFHVPDEQWRFGPVAKTAAPRDLWHRIKPHTCACGAAATGELKLTDGRFIPVCNKHRQPDPQMLYSLIPHAQERSMFRSKVAARNPVEIEPWEPGHHGKGYLTADGEVVHWKGTQWTSAHHHDVMRAKGHSPFGSTMFVLAPTGAILPSFWHDTKKVGDQAKEIASKVPGALAERPPEGWHFGAVVPFKNYEAPVEGQPWKGLRLRNGREFHWKVDPDDLSPHHPDAMWGLGIDIKDVAAFTSDMGEEEVDDDGQFHFAQRYVTNGGHKYRSQYAEEENQLSKPWQSGMAGKWMGDKDEGFHMWSVEDETDGEPHHDQIDPQGNYFHVGDIDPDGTLTTYTDESNEHAQALAARDRRLNLGGQDFNAWHFSNYQEWIQGRRGKGYIVNGEPFYWATEPGGSPHHVDMASRMNHDPDPDCMVMIDATGGIRAADSLDWAENREKWLDVPFFHDANHSGWNLSKVAWEKPDTSQPPEIVHLDEDQLAPLKHPEEFNGPGTRLPFVYHDTDHQVVIGPPDTVHAEIDPNNHGFPGIIWDRKNDGNYVVRALHHKIPQNVLQAVAERANGKVENRNEWHFGTQFRDPDTRPLHGNDYTVDSNGVVGENAAWGPLLYYRHTGHIYCQGVVVHENYISQKRLREDDLGRYGFKGYASTGGLEWLGMDQPDEQETQKVATALGISVREKINPANPTWNFSKTAAGFGRPKWEGEPEPWQPGEHGKWMLYPDGSVESWMTYGFGTPHHEDIQELRLKEKGWPVGYGQISPGGYLESHGPVKHIQPVLASNPNFKMREKDAWHFGSAAHKLNWTPGNVGRYVVEFPQSPDHIVHTWNVDPSAVYGTEANTDHSDYVIANGIDSSRGIDYGYINRQGQPRGGASKLVAQRMHSEPDTEWHFGHTKTADKLHDFLMNPKSRPDLQTEPAQKLLAKLEAHFHNDKTDALMPWLVREWKKGRLQNVGYHPQALSFGEYQHDLRPNDLNHWADWYRSNHPTAKGDIMQKKIEDVMGHVYEWSDEMKAKAHEEALASAEVAHRYPDGWTLQRLTNPEQCTAEGNAMGHCVGGYGQSVENGDTMIYSLRDDKNRPHVTMEIDPQRDDPTHNWFTPSMERHPVAQHFPDHLKDELHQYHEMVAKYGEPSARDTWYGMADPDMRADANIPELYSTIRDDHRYRVTKPIPHGGDVVQIQGKGNEEPKVEYRHRLRDWFEQFPEEDRPVWRDGQEGRYDEDGYYIDELRDPAHIREVDYRPSTQQTDDYGLHAPPLAADYDQLMNKIGINSYGWHDTHNSDHVEAIYNLAKARGEIPKLSKAAEDYQQLAQSQFDEWVGMNHDHDAHPYDPDAWEQLPPDEAAQAEKDYEEEQNSLVEQHPHMMASNQMFNLLQPHWDFNAHRYVNEPQRGPVHNPTTFSKTANRHKRKQHKNWNTGRPCVCGFTSHLDDEHWHFGKTADAADPEPGEYNWPLSQPNAKLHFPTGWDGNAEDTGRGWRDGRVPFVWTQHSEDPNDVHVYFGYPGGEHAGIFHPGGKEWSYSLQDYEDTEPAHHGLSDRLWAGVRGKDKAQEYVSGYGSVKPRSWYTGDQEDKERALEFYTVDNPSAQGAVADAVSAHAPFGLPAEHGWVNHDPVNRHHHEYDEYEPDFQEWRFGSIEVNRPDQHDQHNGANRASAVVKPVLKTPRMYATPLPASRKRVANLFKYVGDRSGADADDRRRQGDAEKGDGVHWHSLADSWYANKVDDPYYDPEFPTEDEQDAADEEWWKMKDPANSVEVDSVDELHEWAPGHEGKGILLRDGSVLTWTDNIHHQQVAQLLSPKDVMAFVDHIAPDGHVLMDYNARPEDYAAVERAGLYPDHNQWKF